MAKEIIPLPTLPKEPNYWRAAWDYFKYFLGAAPVAWLLMFAICQWGLAPVYTTYMALVMANAVGVVTLVLGAMLALVSPRQMTMDEHVVRNRLNMARHFYLNEDQLRADAAELEKSCEELVALSPDGKVKDVEIINHTIKRLRQK